VYRWQHRDERGKAQDLVTQEVGVEGRELHKGATDGKEHQVVDGDAIQSKLRL
jgi:hypothetical protein